MRRFSRTWAGCFCFALLTAPLMGAGLMPPPTGLESAETPEGIQLRWNPAPDGLDIMTGYVVYRSVISTVGDPAVRINAELIQGTEYTDTDVEPGVFFCYTVRATSFGELEGFDSNETCASYQPNAFGFFKRGDVDGDGQLTITDPISLLGHLFLGGARPKCLDAVDFDDSGSVELSDAVASLNYQFLGAGPPAAPGSDACGFDETPDGDVELGCAEHICLAEGT